MIVWADVNVAGILSIYFRRREEKEILVKGL
jgi:hypothetical protein